MSQTEDENLLSFAPIFQLVKREKWILLGFIGLFVLMALVYVSYFTTPIYRATALVMIEGDQENITGFSNPIASVGREVPALNTEAEILKSRDTLGTVVNRLNLLGDPEFCPIETDTEQCVDPELISSIQFNQTVEKLHNAISTRNLIDTYIVEIAAVSTDPKKAALIADTVATIYIEGQIEAKREVVEISTDWLDQRVEEIRQDLEDAETKAFQYRAKINLTSTEGIEALERQLKDTRARIQNASNSLAEAESILERLNGVPEDNYMEIASVWKDASLISLARQLQSNPNLVDRFNAQNALLLRRLHNEIQTLKTRTEALHKSEADIKRNLDSQSQELITLQQMEREVESTKALYNHFLTRLKETSTQEGLQQADSRTIAHAIPPIEPFAPRKTIIVAIAAVSGAFLGFGFILIRDTTRNLYTSAKDLEHNTSVPVFAEVPLLPSKVLKKPLEYIKRAPFSAYFEAFNNLRIAIGMRSFGDKGNTIGITSPLSGDGKTTSSISLANVFSKSGKKVLLVEADMRLGSLDKHFSTTPIVTFSQVLAEGKNIRSAIVYSDELGADVIFGGKASESVVSNLSMASIQNAFTELKTEYDVIVVDLPPVLATSESRLLLKATDIHLLVVAADIRTKQDVESVLHDLALIDVNIDGFIFNRMQMDMQRYNYYSKFNVS
jgi:capsular exopolysaccharide synthesis family protein